MDEPIDGPLPAGKPHARHGWQAAYLQGFDSMSDHREVRVENPMLCAQFTDWLLRQGAPLPWNFGAIIGEIVDAEDRVVFHVDVSYSREKAGQISAAILTAVNTCGGFKVS